jgi:hypothetical protein
MDTKIELQLTSHPEFPPRPHARVARTHAVNPRGWTRTHVHTAHRTDKSAVHTAVHTHTHTHTPHTHPDHRTTGERERGRDGGEGGRCGWGRRLGLRRSPRKSLPLRFLECRRVRGARRSGCRGCGCERLDGCVSRSAVVTHSLSLTHTHAHLLTQLCQKRSRPVKHTHGRSEWTESRGEGGGEQRSGVAGVSGCVCVRVRESSLYPCVDTVDVLESGIGSGQLEKYGETSHHLLCGVNLACVRRSVSVRLLPGPRPSGYGYPYANPRQSSWRGGLLCIIRHSEFEFYLNLVGWLVNPHLIDPHQEAAV